LRNHVAKEIGPVAKPTTSICRGVAEDAVGEIMRRLLKQVASGAEIKGDTTRWKILMCWRSWVLPKSEFLSAPSLPSD